MSVMDSHEVGLIWWHRGLSHGIGIVYYENGDDRYGCIHHQSNSENIERVEGGVQRIREV